MSYRYVIDTFAWIEYLIGSRRGLTAKRYIEGEKAATPTIAIAESAKWFVREIESGRRSVEEMNQDFEYARRFCQVFGSRPVMNPSGPAIV